MLQRKCWQSETLRCLADENRHTIHALALNVHHERGFFSYLARSTTKYICGDARIRKDFKKAVDEAKKSGINLNATSPEFIVGSAGLSLGLMLVQYVPILGVVGAPVIAGFVLILYRIGVDAFCDWSREDIANSPLENT